MLVQELTRDELARYSRHLTLPEVGLSGQRKLKAAKVLLVGAGGLGSPLALYLAAAGVGAIAVIDSDVVELSNLQRQILHSSEGIGINKAASAAKRMHSLNGEIQVTAHHARLEAQNALAIMRDCDVIVDGSDNFPTRYLVNDACVLLGKPNVYGSVYRFEGQASVFDARSGPCYRCLFPQPPEPGTAPSCEEAGVLGVLPGLIGLIQATETVKLIIGCGESLIGRLVLFDALEMRFRELKLRKDPACIVCGPQASLRELRDFETHCARSSRSRADHHAGEAGVSNLTPRELHQMLQNGRPFELLDVREAYELNIAALPYTKHIPVDELGARLHELDVQKETVVYCRSGSRSKRAVELLRKAGFEKTTNLEGGILRWIDDVDPTLSRY